MQAQSEFARSKTIAEQRKFLPVYESRDELLHIIRENQVVVVVGETGSGKTTQVREPLLSFAVCSPCRLHPCTASRSAMTAADAPTAEQLLCSISCHARACCAV